MHKSYERFLTLQVCQCNGNFAGYDCNRCKFGYYGDDCSQLQILPRRPIASYTDEEWEEFIEIIRLLHSHDSGYTVILEEIFPGDPSVLRSNITLYKLYVWIHHYASKDTDKLGTVDICGHLSKHAC